MSAEGGAEPRPLDAGQLRKLSHDQHVVIQRLAPTARTLVAEAGQGRGSWDRGTDRGERLETARAASADTAARLEEDGRAAAKARA
ncbi:hypothetical protein ABTX82_32980 [Streptomyces lavendulae]|uniref:hypothetical protein n=1 Tax=Streptomyces lavendulae TaxID=1914 RepID=UPI003326F564